MGTHIVMGTQVRQWPYLPENNRKYFREGSWKMGRIWPGRKRKKTS